jgi:membrane protein YdbS with pleckstrin-like domain
MPVKIKIVLSSLVATIIGGYGWLAFSEVNGKTGFATIILATLMIISIWIFPETGKVKRKK